MAVSPTELTIVKGESATATISGGATGVYSADTSAHSATIGASISGNIITISTRSNAPDNDTIHIYDGVEEVQISVTTVNPSPESS